MGHSMLDPAAIGKVRPPIPGADAFGGPDFDLHRPANEYRLAGRSVLAAGVRQARRFF
jgi:hypothetical protein